MLDLGLKDLHVLVTGASGGIGVEITKLFLEQGAKVTAQYNTKSTTLEPLLENTSKLHIAQANLSSESSVQHLFTSATNTFGPIHIAIVNHGIWVEENAMLKDMSLERWNFTMDSNLTSAFLVAREFIKGLEKEKAKDLDDQAKEKVDNASIVFVGSTAGMFGEANHSDYAAAKSALMYGLTRTLKNEIIRVVPRGRVNCVAPGWTHTPKKTESLQDPEVVYRATATVPLKKVATPYDIAVQIVILTSSRVSGHVTGHVVDVAGGMEGRLLNMKQDI
ncbi:nad dependent epimerase dehydratase family protein [Moniliophthora roreri MCA 2997]|uniref:Nad dependent epimerase dehydratase family protein n=1 Tax=Moniliophthora roreri (strain MCA 2997) TaxID=1381753 RepID=V2WHQ7_MONRO|nr:nad dependent epimerase dehydratase family protein [Moniliophthora roreri MCA 2997]